MPTPSQRAFDIIHAENVDKYIRDIKKAYTIAINKITKLSSKVNLNKNSEFYFRNHSALNKKINKIILDLNKLVLNTTKIGMQDEWEVAVIKNNELAKWVAGSNIDKLPTKYKTLFLASNVDVRQAFIRRLDNGLGLSSKVWRNSQQFKQELEVALESGIGRGKSAQAIAMEIKQYLIDHNKLFRRVRKQPGGALRLSKAAKAYNPGQGRYRSSYKNAVRLARNETNFSYEESNYQKRNQQPFVVGMKIMVSPQHNPSDDKGGISCIDLQGNYPKNFNWTYKWHVNCRCISLSILKTKGELDEDMKLILSGLPPDVYSQNTVEDMPKSFNSYISTNKKKWKNWKNQPRFLDKV